ncbi:MULTISPECIES: hypothetical protein [Halorussus]|uniref:hypothetical protein n=1 Tax=Halorussus TaxID=1070314 RepID=UPI00209E36C2|nr:hypothetical protein [Halorussus vallis]USZ74051.1 hypothetical protein NGM07_11350 [Halorussus vallis]
MNRFIRAYAFVATVACHAGIYLSVTSDSDPLFGVGVLLGAAVLALSVLSLALVGIESLVKLGESA